MSELKLYDPGEVSVNFALIPLKGFTEDTIVSIEYPESFVEVPGVDGDVSRSKVMARVAVITIHLMQTSRSNAGLSAVHNQDLSASGGAGVAPIMIKDGNGISVFASDKAWISKMPTTTYGKQAGPREWIVKAVNYAAVEGGT